jgi:eukaryotic-like serine/threonine-protein kinase
MMTPVLEPPTPPIPAIPEAWGIPEFELLELIGRGGFGEVLAARRTTDGRAAAVKLVRAGLPWARAQLVREASALRALPPRLAPELLAAGELANGSPWIALERLTAESLAERLAAARGPLPREALAAVALALSDALATLHASGWAHCDLKPGHVFVDGVTARLVDLGLAVGPTPAAARAAVPPGAFAGTAAYMAPEQVRGDAADARSDVYAAGAILFELATGRPPFDGAPADMRQAHLALRPPRPSDRAPVAPALEDVILRCLSKDAGERYADGAALRVALRAAFAARAATTPPPVAAGAPRGPSALPRRTVGVLRLDSDADLLAVRRGAEAAGGRLAASVGGKITVVFEPGARDNAVRLALDGAAGIVAAGLAARAIVDLATVPVLEGPGGARYVLPPAGEAAPRADDPPGLLLTSRAAAAVPEVSVAPIPGRDGILRVGAAVDADTDASRPSLVGRDAVIDRLEEEAIAALGGVPAVAAVTGDPGIGKTRLAAELAARLRALPAAPEVVEVRAREGALGADETLRALLLWALGLPPRAAAPADGGRAALASALPGGGESWPPVALALGWLGADAPALRPWRAAPGALRAAVVRAAGEGLRVRAPARPLCILVDDAHLADAAALDALEYAALAEAAAPLFVCALGRPALAAARPGLGERSARAVELTLGPLSADDAAELCRRLLLPAENVPARAVERLVERAQGVPVLLVELVRGLRARGLVRQRGGEGSWYVATDELEDLPGLPLVDWLAQREMAGLPEALAAHARLVALLADEVARDEVAGVVAELDRDGAGASVRLDPDVAVRRLLELRVLVARGDRVAFRHPLLRDAVGRAAGEAERRAVHRAAFRHYVLAAMSEQERLPRLAFHAEASGLRAEAASLWLRMAEALRARHAYLEAETHYTRAAAQLSEEDARGRFLALRGRGVVRYRLGRYDDAIADLAAAVDRARALGDPAGEVECLLDEATALDWMNDYARSAECVRDAERLAGASPAPLAAARLELARGRALLRAARWPDAAAALEAAAALAEPLGDDGYETLVVALLLGGFVLPNLGRAADAERVLSRALALARERGDPLHLASALNNRRNLWVARGELDHALDDQRAFLRIGRDLGMVGIEYVGQFNLGELLYQSADLDRAEAHVLRAVEIERRHPEIAARPVARLLHARLLAYRGDLPAAGARLAEIAAIEAAARREGRAGALLAASDRVLADMVDLAAAGGAESDWADLCERSRTRSVEQEPIEVHEVHAVAALRAGRPVDAAAAAAEALGLAEAIPNVMEERVRGTLAAARAANARGRGAAP